MDFPLQQDRCRDRGNAARCSDLGNAGNLCRRIPLRLLDTASSSGAAGTLSPVSTARLRALACVFARDLAYVLARPYWFGVPFCSLCDHYLFSHAPPDQSREGNAEKSMKVERLVSTRWQRMRLCRQDICAFGAWFGIVFGEADPPAVVLGTRRNQR